MSRAPARGAAAVIQLAVLLIAGAVLWAGGVLAVARSSEDVCLRDLHGPYGGYTEVSDMWPPRYRCVLSDAAGGTAVRDHAVFAWGRFAAWFVAPAVYALVAVVGVVLLRRRRRVKGSDPRGFST